MGSRSPFGLKVIQSCMACPVHEDSIFCGLGPGPLEALNAIRRTTLYPRGAVLFVQGQPSQGLFVLCSGQVKLTTSSARGRSVIVRVVGPGEVLGLGSTMTATPYDVSAETLEPAEVNFLPRDQFMLFLQRHGEVAVRVAQCLGTELHRAYSQMARVALAPTAKAKLAGLLLDWASRATPSTAGRAEFPLRLSHQEIGELIGSSRETVTRLLAQLRREGLVKTRASLVTLPDVKKLQSLLE